MGVLLHLVLDTALNIRLDSATSRYPLQDKHELNCNKVHA